MKVLALADDMTGALEAGAHFSAHGLEAVVSTRPLPDASEPVLVLDTETRHLSPGQAAERIAEFVRQSAAEPPWLIYKKTDSTLRGNIRSELCGLARLYPQWTVGYAPAHPILGRTVANGCLLVHGVPVHQTEFAQDCLNPVLTASIAELLGDELRAKIFDAEHAGDTEAAARSILADPAMRIAAGPSALAEQLARLMEHPRTPPAALRRIGTCVVVNGSRHSVSRVQVERADVSNRLWRPVALAHPPNADPAAVAHSNAQATLSEIERTGADAVFVIGGDTAFAFLEALGSPPVYPICEVAPGVPASRIGGCGDLLLITKAGGFGDADLLRTLEQKLTTHAH